VTTGSGVGGRRTRAGRVVGVVVAVFVGLRVLATAGQPITTWPDSASYFDFRWWGGVRFPVVTAPYALLGDPAAVVTVQAVVGALAWAVAVLVAARLVPVAVPRVGFVVLGCILGLTPPVTSWDRTLLSESFAISLTVLLVATLLHFACRPGRTAAVAVVVAGAGWGLSRPNQSLLLVVGAGVLAALGSVRSHRRWAWPVAGVLATVALVGIAMAASTSQVQEYNSGQIVVRRVLGDDARTAWFRARGMPGNGPALLVPPYDNVFGDPAVELQRDPRFGPWLRGDFPSAYLRYLATHPGYTVGLPFGAEGAWGAALGGTSGYGNARAVLPAGVPVALWPDARGAQRLVVGLGAVVLVAAAVGAVRSPGRRRALAGAGGVLVVVAANVVLVTHTAGLEYERLLLPTATGARFALLWLAAVTLGGVTVSAPAASAGPATQWRRRGGGRTGRGPDPAPRTPDGPAPADSPSGPGGGPGTGPPGTP
jgi:hypothetical protein